MITMANNTRVVQNMGLIDRLIRLLLGAIVMGASYHTLVTVGSPAPSWTGYAFGIVLYPIFTGMLGWDPFYALFDARSCGDLSRNPCGSLPYQIKALFGRPPQYCETDADRSLESCHDEPGEHPHHKVWRVDAEPALYPDDRAWHRYFSRHKKPAPGRGRGA